MQELLRAVGLTRYFNNRYPHEFSGGQRQRIGIARALALRAEVHRLRRAGVGAGRFDPGPDPQPAGGPAGELGLTYLFIAHDLAVVQAFQRPRRGDVPGQDRARSARARICTRPAASLHARAALVDPGARPAHRSKRRLVELSGEIPSPLNPPSGCLFHTRCPIAQVPGICADVVPPLELKPDGHHASCHFSDQVRTKIQVTA